ncbi:MAG: hypothetical protein QOC64_300 [Solirubrobacteraceae bacterium]|nr:hypothetical protein [Solirubrobacteraceae bacterium]
MISENPQHPEWDERPDGSRVRHSNGIRIVDRTGAGARADACAGAGAEADAIEHLVTWREPGGSVIVLGLDESCRPVYTTTLYEYL